MKIFKGLNFRINLDLVSTICLLGENTHDEVIRHEMIPMNPTHLSFWQKFWELHYKMIMTGHDRDMEHKYSSSPLDWPFMKKNVAYWLSDNSNVSNIILLYLYNGIRTKFYSKVPL